MRYATIDLTNEPDGPPDQRCAASCLGAAHRLSTGKPFPLRRKTPRVTADARPRPAASPTQREGSGGKRRCTRFSTSIRRAFQPAPATSGAAANGAIRRIDRDGDRVTVIAKYERWLADQHHLLRALDELRGHDLVCFCAPRACHGDLLLRLANATREVRIAWRRAVRATA